MQQNQRFSIITSISCNVARLNTRMGPAPKFLSMEYRSRAHFTFITLRLNLKFKYKVLLKLIICSKIRDTVLHYDYLLQRC